MSGSETKHAPDASIVIVAYGKRAVTKACLDSLQRSLSGRIGSSLEIVLVDNASPDDTLDLFAEWEDRARIVRLPKNLNFAGGCNAGAAVASGSVIVFLNNDTEVGAGALQGLIAEALGPSVGAVGLRLLYPDGRLQHAGFGFRRDAGSVLRPFHYFHGEPGSLPAARATYDLDAVTAACVAIRTEVFREAGGFDEGFVNGWEDIDLCLKLRRRGLRVVYRGDLGIVHHEGATGGKMHGASGNEARFRERWEASLQDDRDRIAELFGARFNPAADAPGAPHPHASGSRLSVEGLVRSCAPEGAEARAIIEALEGNGLNPAARDWFPTWITPELDSRLEPILARALARPKHPDGLVVQVPPEQDARGTGMPTVLRLASVPSARALRTAFSAWVASPQVARALTEAGFPEAFIHALDPAIGDFRCTAGGEGIMAVLPSHDLTLARATAQALAGLGDVVPVRLAWTVSAPHLLALAQGWNPKGSVDPRAASESMIAAIAAKADVVVHFDRSDGFQRFALIAAAHGAAPVARGDGAAEAVLGPSLHAPLSTSPSDIRVAIEQALGSAPEREARSRTVTSRCGSVAIGARLRELARRAMETKEIRRGLVSAGAAGSAGSGRDPQRESGHLSRALSHAAPSEPEADLPEVRPALELSGCRDDESQAPMTARSETVLMWYPELPDPDRSSGHRRAFEVLRSLARLGCRPALLTFESAGADGAMARLEDDGVEVCAADRPGVDVMALLHRGFSVAIVSFFDVAERAIPLIRSASPATRIVVDTVDIHYRRLERAAVLEGNPEALAGIPALRRRELGVYALADLVLAVSEEEQELLCEQLSAVPVAVVPNVHHVADSAPPVQGRSGAIFVGGYGHPPNVDAVRFLGDEILPRLRALGYQDPVAVAGSRMPADLAAHARRSGLDVLGFLASVERELDRRRLSIAPLRYGAGLKGKVGEALAAGLPVVGTTIAAEGYAHPERGMLVEDGPDGFARAMVRLSTDDELWTRLSEGGRSLIGEQLGPARCDRELGDVLEHLFAEECALAR